LEPEIKPSKTPLTSLLKVDIYLFSSIIKLKYA
jgi:hypothetical protein